jgi:formylglycine-generating enzyme required for sulfatase activity
MAWGNLGVTLVATAAFAGPKTGADDVGVQLDGRRNIAAALRNAGWVATPEGSDRYQAGFVYDARNGLWSDRDGCFDAAPNESIYNEMEVVQALQAGARVPLGVVTAEAEGVRYRKLTYADPRISEIQGRQLKLAETCKADLMEAAKSGDISSWYVVQAVLFAVVNEQECTEIDAGVKSVVGTAGIEVSEQCATRSVGQVAVAFKTVPVTELLGIATAPTPTVVSMGPASSVRGGASFDTLLDVDAALKEQACASEASSAAAAARAKKVAAAVAGEQATATAAWNTLGPAAEKCTAMVDPATRKGCADKVAAFVAQAEALTIEVTSGFETVATACGSRQVPLAAERPSVPVAEVASARAALVRLQQPGAAPPGQSYDVRGYTMVALAPGSFDMGCTPGQGSECEDDEKLVHRVELTAPFWIGATEVTQGLYRSVTGKNPSHFSTCGDDCPVEQVTWCDAVAFANALSVAERLRPAYTVPGGFVVGRTAEVCNAASPMVVWDRTADGYRLPTEAEWEYAARAGQDLPYSGSSEPGAVAWYSGGLVDTATAARNELQSMLNAIVRGEQIPPALGVWRPASTQRVGTKSINQWGLYDMSGNVYEWVGDWYASTYNQGPVKNPPGPGAGDWRVYRGGGVWSGAAAVRNANRGASTSGFLANNLGFRLARGVPGPVSAP